jgi:hypothetical protein
LSTKKFKVKFCYWNKFSQWYEDEGGSKYVRIGGKSGLHAIGHELTANYNFYIGKQCNESGTFEVCVPSYCPLYMVERILREQSIGRDNRIILVRVH